MGSVSVSATMDQSQYPPVATGLSGAPLPASSSQQQPPNGGGYPHAGDSGPVPASSSSSSSTQHLTSASLASLARLSQLSGSEGPFCSTPQANSIVPCPPPPPPAFSRMASAPDILGFSGGPGPGGMMINPDGDPNPLYSMGSAPANSSTASSGSTYQNMVMPQGAQQVRPYFINNFLFVGFLRFQL